MLRAVALLCLLSAVFGASCGEPKRLEDFLPPDPDAVHEDPLLGPLDDDFREPTDVDHATARGKLSEIAEQVKDYQARSGRLPDALDSLTEGGDMDSGKAIIPDGAWRVPVDPWGSPYEYERLAEGGFSVRSLGPDGERYTVDDLVHNVPMSSPDLVRDK
ncbi:MAG: type II secretion system protein GspG [Planctomycetota bacterium]|nr:type II secretion system protein GspG [Planctomycetota bacterium]